METCHTYEDAPTAVLSVVGKLQMRARRPVYHRRSAAPYGFVDCPGKNGGRHIPV